MYIVCELIAGLGIVLECRNDAQFGTTIERNESMTVAVVR